MGKLKLTVNEAKTRICRLPEEKFDFLGYTFGRCYSPKTGRAYLGTVPAPKRIQHICGKIRATTARTRTSLDSGTIVAKLNRMLVGWTNYFCLGLVSKAYRAVDSYAKMRLRLWCVPSIKSSDVRTKCFPISTSMKRWVSFALIFGLATFRGRKHESFPRAGCGRSASPVR